MIKIGIVEDIPQLANALKEKVELAPEMKVKHMAANGNEIIDLLQKDHNIDVLLMDIYMPQLDGIAATERITKRWPHIKIVMSTVFSDEQYLFNAIMVGATGYLLKDEPPAMIHKAIYEAIEGGAPMSKEMARKSLKLIRNNKKEIEQNIAEEYNLTAREIEIIEHLSRGNSYEQIADNLFISCGTVRKHVENCYRKLRVHNKLEAINKLNKS